MIDKTLINEETRAHLSQKGTLSSAMDPLFLRLLGEWLSMVTSRDEHMANGGTEET